jgi:omega-amidase
MKLTISLAQIDVAVSDPEANIVKAESLVAEAARRKSDLICFPEMWTTGFNWDYNRRTAADHARSAARVADIARRHSIWINGTMPESAGPDRLSNASVLYAPDGRRAGVYGKAHLFSFMGEDRHMVPGPSICLADAPWGATGLAVCYDVRFPELFRTYALKGAALVLLPAAFPHPRLEHWRVLVRARAIENQMFVAAINQVGTEELADGPVAYFGNSMIVDPWGGIVAEAGEEEALVTATIDTGMVDEVRGRMRVLGDRRPDLYEL